MTDHVKWLYVIVVVILMLVAFSLDDPSYYGPGNDCPVNQPTPCN